MAGGLPFVAAAGLAGVRLAAVVCLLAPRVAATRLVLPLACATGTTSLVTRIAWPVRSASPLKPFHAFSSCTVTP